MNPFPALWTLVKANSKSVRLTLTVAGIVFLTSVFVGTVHSPDELWVVDGSHWRLEQYSCDILVAAFVCLITQSLCWMDTIRPLDKTNKDKLLQLTRSAKEDVAVIEVQGVHMDMSE